MPIPDEYQSLVPSLIEKTKEGKLPWKAGPEDDEFYLSFEESSIIIRQVQWGINAYYRLVLNDAHGDDIDSFRVDSDDTEYQLMIGLWDIVRRKVFKVGERIRDIEDRISRLGQDEE